MMKLINLTTHTIHLLSEDGQTLLAEWAPDGTVARVDVTSRELEPLEVEGLAIPFVQTSNGRTTGLPAAAPLTYYIVSRLVASENPERSDLVFPDRMVRYPADYPDKKLAGKEKGCRSFGRVAPKLEPSTFVKKAQALLEEVERCAYSANHFEGYPDSALGCVGAAYAASDALKKYVDEWVHGFETQQLDTYYPVKED